MTWSLAPGRQAGDRSRTREAIEARGAEAVKLEEELRDLKDALAKKPPAAGPANSHRGSRRSIAASSNPQRIRIDRTATTELGPTAPPAFPDGTASPAPDGSGEVKVVSGNQRSPELGGIAFSLAHNAPAEKARTARGTQPGGPRRRLIAWISTRAEHHEGCDPNRPGRSRRGVEDLLATAAGRDHLRLAFRSLE